MKRGVVLISFDVEEFDLPREHGAKISLEEGVKVSAEGLERILKMLKRLRVKATFFITGNFANERPDLVLKIRDAGHEVACHGVDHFKPKKTDVLESKKIVERVAGVKVTGYRQPRMFKISYRDLKKCGYKYDSSVNPAFIPGRYNHLNVPRTPFVKKGIVEVPTSVFSLMRVPLFWLALHLFPLSLYVDGAKMSLKKTGYFATYFHPWEFAEALNCYKKVPPYIKYNSGKRLVKRLEKVVLILKKSGYKFTTYEKYVREWYNEFYEEV
jgi:peptidoglycan/xylan/chitin deacetylase (PgdA/CDA1 family)